MDTKTSTSRHKNGFNKPIATQKGDGGNFFVPSKIVAMILSCMGNTRSIYLLKTGHSATKNVPFTNFFSNLDYMTVKILNVTKIVLTIISEL